MVVVQSEPNKSNGTDIKMGIKKENQTQKK